MDEEQSGRDRYVDDAEVQGTGMPAVDDVLDRVANLADVPVSQHVAVFERAHEQLRRALDAQPDD
jgi:hypothetical protein